MTELKPIKGFEGLYQVSTEGHVFSCIANKQLKPYKMPNGYLQVTLYSQDLKKQKKKAYIHRLVAEAFLPNPTRLLEVNHKDENKENNRVDNLEWVTRSINMLHGTRIERQKNTLKNNRKQLKPVDCFRKNGDFICTYLSIKEASAFSGIAATSISACCKNKPGYKTAGGMRWKYHSKGGTS